MDRPLAAAGPRRPRARVAAARAAAALVLLFPLCHARAADGEVALRARPAALVLGAGARAFLEVDAPHGPPSITASVGRVESVRLVGEGRYRAEYVPPPAAYPQVGIVSAVSGGQAAWVAIPLVGHGIATARSRPGAAIRVTIGAAVFGPVRADASGEARVPVDVPPGVRFAYHGDRPLDLGIPETLHLHLAVGRDDAPADAGHEVPIWVFAVTAGGAPRARAPVSVHVTQGAVEDLREVGPGTLAGTWRLPPGRPEPAVATARLADEARVTPDVVLARPAGAPARLAVAVAGSPLEPGEARVVRVEVSDAAGNPLDVAPRLEASLGTLSGPTRAGAGIWEATLAVPRELRGEKRVELVARAARAEERVALPLASATAARLVVAADRDALVADGRAEARLRVEVLDRFGNVVDVPSPELAPARRASVSTERDADGAWIVRYRPARARTGTAEVVAVQAGGMAGTARLLLAAPERRLSVAPKLGFAASTGGLRSALLAVEAALRLPLRSGRLGGALELGTFAHDRTDVVSAGAGSLEVHGRARYLTLLASARWREPLGARLSLVGDAGGGLAHLRGDVAAGSAPASRTSRAVVALHAAAGLGLRLGPGAALLEARVARFGDPAREALRGPLTLLTLAVGYRYDAY